MRSPTTKDELREICERLDNVCWAQRRRPHDLERALPPIRKFRNSRKGYIQRTRTGKATDPQPPRRHARQGRPGHLTSDARL